MNTQTLRPSPAPERRNAPPRISPDALLDQERRRVSMRACVDRSVYEQELDAVFGRAWICVAHASEIRNPGDFVLRYIGEDSVIVIRERSGGIGILLNQCTHRGMQVCREEAGRNLGFVCPYHGWSFSDTGALLGAPAAADHYGENWDRSSFGLKKARCAEYAGFVFGCWDPQAPSLDDYLGASFRWYLDMMLSRTKGGLEVLGPPQRWIVNANWKLASEQFSGDSYHTLTAHRSMAELKFANSEEFYASLRGVARLRFRQGHGMQLRDVRGRAKAGAGEAVERLGSLLPAGITPELSAEVEQCLQPQQLRLMQQYPPGPLSAAVFPNLFFITAPHPTAEGEVGAVLSPRMWNPRGPDKLEAMVWMLVEKDAAPEYKELCRRANTLHFSSSGVIEQDDAECWAAAQRALGGHEARKQFLDYSAVQPLTDPASVGWPGPTQDMELRLGWTRDDPGWQFWSRWRDFMRGDPWGTGATGGAAQ